MKKNDILYGFVFSIIFIVCGFALGKIIMNSSEPTYQIYEYSRALQNPICQSEVKPRIIEDYIVIECIDGVTYYVYEKELKVEVIHESFKEKNN